MENQPETEVGLEEIGPVSKETVLFRDAICAELGLSPFWNLMDQSAPSAVILGYQVELRGK
jgi:hypothetical protein